MPPVGLQCASTTPPPVRGRGFCVAGRVLVAVVGGYWLTSGLASLGALGFATLMPPSEAVVLTAMLGFVVYLLLLLWAFAERFMARLWLVFGAGPVAVWVMVYTVGTLAPGA